MVINAIFEGKVGQIYHRKQEAFISSFLVKLVGHITILLDAVAELVARAQVVLASFTTFIGGLFKPFCRLLVVAHIVVVQTTESVHGKDVAVNCSFLVSADRSTDVLLNSYAFLIVLSELVIRFDTDS